VRILAVDYGSARTGVAVSDPTGSIASPLGIVERVGSERGMEALCALIGAQAPSTVVVGLPRPLSGGDNRQLRAVLAFIEELRSRVSVPVETYDERFTTAVALRRGGEAALDARAAAHLLEDYLKATACVATRKTDEGE
jgi:putative holliday junction resolvase